MAIMAAGVVGREAERAALSDFPQRIPRGPCGLVVEGEAGIGKTTLWQQGVSAAAEAAHRVLSSRPSESEAQLSFTGLGDLFEGWIEGVLPELPPPQRRALEVALLRATRKGPPPDRRVLSVAALGALRALAESQAVVIAIDDVQWLDRATTRVLEFVARRLETEPLGFLLALRASEVAAAPLGLDRGLPEDRLERIRLTGLTPDELEALISDRFGTHIPRHTLMRLHAATGGNPFFALEVARGIVSGEVPLEPGQPIPTPRSAQEAIQERLAKFPPEHREVLLAASALARPAVDLIERAVRPRSRVRKALADAQEAGVIEVRGGVVRFTHPLLASGIYEGAPVGDRRDVHRRLADLVVDPEEQARHLALAAGGPDGQTADTLERAAGSARGKGSPDAAAELLEMSRRLTPGSGSVDARRRGIEAARDYFDAGDTKRARALLEEIVEGTPPGADRVEALMRLGWARWFGDDVRAAARLFEQALEESGDDVTQRAHVEEGLAWTAFVQGDAAAADAHATAAVEFATRQDDRAMLAQAWQGAANFQAHLGRPEAAESIRRSMDFEPYTLDLHALARPSWVLALIRMYGDDLHEARDLLVPLCAQASEMGDEGSQPLLLTLLSEVETLTGDLREAERHASDGYRIALRTGQERGQAFALASLAMISALSGQTEKARATIDEGLTTAERVGTPLASFRLLFARGFLELSLGNPRGAYEHLCDGAVGEWLSQTGIGEPSAFAFVPDGIEASTHLGRLDQAENLLVRWRDRAADLGRSWALAASDRCRGLILAARGELPAAMSALERAVSAAQSIPRPFELGRVLLSLGSVKRRAKQKRVARELLERAAALFDDLGVPLWAGKAREELKRIGGRAPSPTELTATEKQVADLVAEGGTNREIAAALFMSERTVEANLTRIYRKLGLRSRTQLTRALHGAKTPEADREARVRKAFMFADIVRSTKLPDGMGEEAWEDLVGRHGRMVRSLVAEHGGVEIDDGGDGFFLAFPTPTAGVDCAVAIQRALADHRHEHGFVPSIRIGVHWAEAISRGRSFGGTGVYQAAHIADLAEADQIMVSEEILAQGPLGHAVSDPRTVTLKGFSEPMQVSVVRWQ